MEKYQTDTDIGCGLGIFRRWSFRQQKTLVHSLSIESTNYYALKSPVVSPKKPPRETTKTPGGGKRDMALLEAPKVDPKSGSKTRHLSLPGPPKKPEGGQSSGREANSSEGKALVRASSTNVTLPTRQLGNLRSQEANDHVSPSRGPRNIGYGKLGGNVLLMGNIVRQPSPVMITNSADPEALKNMGNERYREGRFKEALALYDRAIALDPGKATYRSNRSAALIGLGRLLEATSECKEAVRLDPCYQRAHLRLATLYVRLGEPGKALDHYKHSRLIAAPEQVEQAQALERQLKRCTESQMLREWSTLLKETELAISSGADSAPQVYAMQAEALLRLRRYQDSYKAYLKRPNLEADLNEKLFGRPATSYMLTIQAQVYLAAGRFQDALSAAQKAARVDPSDKEANRAVRLARAISSARLSGNSLFEASKFREACVVYSEGLEYDPYNPVLLCNRAACRTKLRHFEKAVEDCSTALDVQPNYAKARLRRADCYSKMEKWEAAAQDYEMLARESPGDESVAKALHYVQAQVKRKQGEYVSDRKSGPNSRLTKLWSIFGWRIETT